MKQIIIALLMLTLIGCEKESPDQNIGTMTGSWYHEEQHMPQAPSSRTIVLNEDGTTAGGTWELVGTQFTMVRYGTTYNGTITSVGHISGTTVPAGTFSMIKQ